MKLRLTYKQLGGMPPAMWLRRAGYSYHADRNGGQDSFVRRLNGDFYPRFHVYIQEVPGTEELILNLHLDQKKASYVGVARHSGEYEGELVAEESARLQALMQPVPEERQEEGKKQYIPGEAPRDVLHSLQPKELREIPRHKKLPWWKRLFS